MSTPHPLPPPTTPARAKIELLYDGFATAVRGRAFCEQLTRQLELDGHFDESLWRTSLLFIPEIRQEAARAALAADFVVLSLRGDGALSDGLERWCDAWMPHAAKHNIALAFLHDPATAQPSATESVRSFLRKACAASGVDFFTLAAPANGADGAEARSPNARRGRGPEGTILVVDDDPGIRKMVTLSLNLAGHRTLNAPDGEAAREVIENHAPDIDLVITDIEMPRLRGDDLAVWVGREHPETRVLLMSSVRPATVGTLALPFLDKPFREEALVSMVGQLLGAAARA